MTKIVLIGAGSVNFGLGIVGDLIRCNELKGATFALCDTNEQSLKTIHRAVKEHFNANDLPFSVVASTDRKKLLEGADFVVNSIEVGDRFKLWEQDRHIAQQYGFRQVFGENGGPGGLFHSLRIIPPILAIARDVMEIAPDAHFFNLSNPMTRISYALVNSFPQLRYTGLCHEIASLPRHLPKLLGRSFDRLQVVAGGFNHFSVLVSCHDSQTGEDLYPEILDKMPGYFSTTESEFGHCGERKLFLEIVDAFKLLPITTDSHIGEYIPWAATSADHDGILQFYNSYKQKMLANAGMPLERLRKGTPSEEYWRIAPIFTAIVTGERHHELAVNVRNDGFIDGIPGDQVVEVPGDFDRRGVTGHAIADYPQAFLGLLQNQVAVNRMTTEAVKSKSREAVLQALLVDPLTHDIDDARNLIDTMIMLQGDYLGYIA